jgi:hypothetical protein
MKTKLTLLTLVSAFSLQPSALLGQGSLTPPGAPAPTMKTLDQVEPRTDVMKLSGDASNLYIIANPGSYYLTTNLMGVSGKHGISIQADHVTLDLNGFAMLGAANGTGILVPADRRHIVIRNGIVRGWGRHGVFADKAHHSRVEDLLVSSNGYSVYGYGITIGTNGLVRGCSGQQRLRHLGLLVALHHLRLQRHGERCGRHPHLAKQHCLRLYRDGECPERH